MKRSRVTKVVPLGLAALGGVVVFALVPALASSASGASVAKAPPTVTLKVSVAGHGTVRVTGRHAFTCRAASCRHSFQVRRGRRVVVRASAASGWKLASWTGACHGSRTICSLRPKAPRSVAVRFVPPGDHLNPYPLGTAAMIYGGWQLKINSATLNANAEVRAVIDPNTGLPANPPPPEGFQYTLISASMTYTGSGSSNLKNYLERLWISAHAPGPIARGAPYTVYGCTPPPVNLHAIGEVVSGQTETGYFCLLIQSSDASALILVGSNEAGNANLYFALR